MPKIRKNSVEIQLVFIASLFLFVFATQIFAEELNKVEPVIQEAVLLADVNIKDATIISQDKSNLKISFIVSNNDDAQSGLRYGVKLYSLDKDGNILGTVDEKNYDEVFSLPTNGIFEKEIIYDAPTSLSGNFELFLFIKNKTDFLFSIDSLGKINLATSSGIQLINESCKILVNQKSENNISTYQLFKIKKEDKLSITCDVNNYENSLLSLSPIIETRYNSTFGDIIPSSNSNTPEISIKGLEKKNLSIEIPVVDLIAQQYSTTLYFKSDKFSSNKLTINYIIDGTMVIINNLSIDSDYYKKGDIAKVYFVGSFYFSDVTDDTNKTDIENINKEFIITSKITSAKNNKVCGSSDSGTLSMLKRDPKLEIPVNIKRDCLNPIVLVTVKNLGGDILQEQTFSFVSTNIPVKENNLNYIILIILLIILIGIYIYIKNKKHNNPSDPSISAISIIFVLFILSFLIPSTNASAATFSIGMYAPVVSTVTVNFAGSKTSYTPGEDITVTGKISYPTATGTGMPIYDFKVNGVRFSGAPALPTQVLNYPWTKTFKASTTAGTYTVEYSVDMYCPSGARFDRVLGYCYNPELSLREYNIMGNLATNRRTLDCDFSFNNWHPMDFLSISSQSCSGAITNIYVPPASGQATVAPNVDDTLNKLVADFNAANISCTALPDKTRHPYAIHQAGTNTVNLFSQYADTLSCSFYNSEAPDNDIYTYSASYSVVAPTVDVKVDTVDGPITKSTGSSVNVSWTSTNASSCSCTYIRAGQTISCGNELFTPPDNPKLISNLLEPTTFTVSCDP